MDKRSDIHALKMRRLNRKLRQAERKKEERELKRQIIKTALPLEFKFSKFIVLFCIVAIVAYTIAAILLQKNIAMEISPTLTTCVYTFFGSELLGMAGIKIFDTKYNSQVAPMSTNESELSVLDGFESVDIDSDDSSDEAVG